MKGYNLEGKDIEQLEHGGSKLYLERLTRSPKFKMRQEHYHFHYEVYYLISGECSMLIDHTIFYLKPGDAALIPPVAVHHSAYQEGVPSERVAVSFQADYLEHMAQICGQEQVNELFERGAVTIPEEQRGYVEEMFDRIAKEQVSRDVFSGLLCQNYLYEMLICFGRWGKMKEAWGEAIGKDGTREPVRQAIRYIYLHFAESLTLEEIAAEVHISPSYLSRQFKKATGFGYKEYLNHIRLKEAVRLLMDTRASVTEIALACGFGDGNYFGDVFKREKGMSPSKYRKACL